MVDFAFANDLPVPAVLNWYGIAGVPAAEALIVRSPQAPGARENITIPMRHAGTLLCDLRLLGDGQAQPSRSTAIGSFSFTISGSARDGRACPSPNSRRSHKRVPA